VVLVLGALTWLLSDYGHVNPAAWAYENPSTVVALVVAYLAIGFVWIWFRWIRLVEEYRSDGRKQLLWSAQKYNFSGYFFYWPIDVVVFILGDLLEDIWRFVSNAVEESFNNYAAKRLGGDK
jgi:hypothetical protein